MQVLLPFPAPPPERLGELTRAQPSSVWTRQIPAVWINPWYSPTSLNNSSTSRSLSLLPTRRRKECGTIAGVKHWSTHGNSYVWQSHRTSVRTKRAFLRGLLLPRRVQSTPLSASSRRQVLAVGWEPQTAVFLRHPSMAATTGAIWLCACVRYWPYWPVGTFASVLKLVLFTTVLTTWVPCGTFKS